MDGGFDTPRLQLNEHRGDGGAANEIITGTKMYEFVFQRKGLQYSHPELIYRMRVELLPWTPSEEVFYLRNAPIRDDPCAPYTQVAPLCVRLEVACFSSASSSRMMAATSYSWKGVVGVHRNVRNGETSFGDASAGRMHH